MACNAQGSQVGQVTQAPAFVDRNNVIRMPCIPLQSMIYKAFGNGPVAFASELWRKYNQFLEAPLPPPVRPSLNQPA
jgi:hypothetical protein